MNTLSHREKLQLSLVKQAFAPVPPTTAATLGESYLGLGGFSPEVRAAARARTAQRLAARAGGEPWSRFRTPAPGTSRVVAPVARFAAPALKAVSRFSPHATVGMLGYQAGGLASKIPTGGGKNVGDRLVDVGSKLMGNKTSLPSPFTTEQLSAAAGRNKNIDYKQQIQQQ